MAFGHLVKTAGITAVISAAGAVAGLALDALILFWYGAGRQTDALFAALVLPMLFVGVLSIQAPKILVPIFSLTSDANERDAWILLCKLLTMTSLCFACLVLIGVALADIIVPFQVAGLDPSTIKLTVQLNRVLLSLVWLQGLSAILQAVLYARHSYAVSSAGKLVTNVSAITIVAVIGPNRGGIHAVAWGLVFGSFVQLLLLLIVLARHGFRYHWRLDVRDKELKRVLLSFNYPLVGHILGESSGVVQTLVASFLGSGTVTLLHYASRILGAIGGILLGSVVQVTLPLVATYAASNDLRQQKRTLLESIQILSLMVVPLSIWLVFVAHPLVALLFQRGQFSSADASTTALIIRAMILYFCLARFVSVTQTLFYANADFRTPFISTVIFTVANTVFALMLANRLSAPGIGFAVSVASVCNSAYMIAKLHSRFGSFEWPRMWPFALRLGGSGVLAAIGFAVGLSVSSGIAVSQPMAMVLAVAIPTMLGFGVFGVGVVVCGLYVTPFQNEVAV